MLGFLRWAFKDCYKSVQFYAFLTVLFSIVMQFGGCPDPWPFRIMLVGIVISLVDAVVWFAKFQYLLYRQEQDRMVRELSRK